MAFQTGSQINPALGRVDYTPYMQGAVAGAQSIGQGIASLGQSVGAGIEAYAKRKKENKMMEASLKANINSLEGLSKIASSLSPQAQEQFNSTMQQLNDPSVPLTEKVALSEAAQKTVGELINFGMQEKQKQEQALSQQLAYDAAVSGQSIPLIYPQSVRAPAALQSLAIQGQFANIAETNAKAAAVANMPVMTLEKAQAQANAMASASGKDFIGKTVYDEKTGGYTPSIVQKPAATFAPPTEVANAELRATSIKGRIDEERSAYSAATSGASNARLIQKAFESGKVTAGTFGKVSGYLKTLGESIGLGDLGATEQDLAIQGLNALQADKVRGIMKGLGSMSNSDREFATASMPTIANPEINIKYYVELAKENERLAKEDQAFIRKLEREGNVPQEEIFRRLDEVRENRVGVAESIYNRVVGSTTPAPAPAPAGGVMKIGRFNVIQSQ